MSINQDKFDFLGISKFHSKGYKGAGITIASRESDKSLHGGKVANIIKQIVPDAKILLSVDYKKDAVNYDIYTSSWSTSSDTLNTSVEALEEINKKAFLVCAIGNDSETSQSNLAKNEYVNSVGACILKNDKPERAYYSSISNDLDFMSLTNMYTEDGAKFTGTSCAAPVFASMCALIQSFFLYEFGRKLSNKELLEFIKENCIDLKEKGKDKYTGYGIFVLPDPDNIDFEKYKIIKELTPVPNEEVKTDVETDDSILAEAEKETISTELTTCEKCGKLRNLLNKLLSIFKKK